MPSLEDGLYTFLAAQAGISALVGTRIYPLVAPEGAVMPCIVYQRIGGSRVVSHSGDSELARPRIQVSAWAETYDEAKSIAEAVVAATSGYSGTWGSVSIGAVEVEDGPDDYDEATRLYRKINDLIVYFTEVL